MTKEELQNFIKDNPSENDTLEYKIKPNFTSVTEIKDFIKKTTDKMHPKILKTIYAFANTEGGKLFIGIEDNKVNNQR